MKLMFLCLTVFLTLQSAVFGQTNKFQIVYAAYPEAINATWLTAVKDWGGTGVAILVNWWQYEPSQGSQNWTLLDAAINLIQSQGLTVQLRVALGEYPGWVNPQPCDLATKSDGSVFTLYTSLPRLNFASTRTLNFMYAFYDNLLGHIAETWGSSIKEISPSISPDYELEYTWAAMLGYSSVEIVNFRNYLAQEYNNDINLLNTRWQSPALSSFSMIDPEYYHWDSNDNSTYVYPNGRVDWMNYRTSQLKSFIDALASSTHTFGFNMILQVGSLYDDNIERRGWIDPTPLFENVDRVVNGDVIEYDPNFGFAADYIRSLCQYWERENGRKHSYSTESDNAGYGGYSPSTLVSNWTDQLLQYFNKGADIHYISHWDGFPPYTLSTPVNPQTATAYSGWRTVLKQYSGSALVTKPNFLRAIHLSCERLAYTHNPASTTQGSPYKTFDIFNSVMTDPRYSSPSYDGFCDVVTSCMLQHATYINRYTGQLSFTKGSSYIAGAAYFALMRTDVTVGMLNATSLSNGNGPYDVTMGISDEYGGYRSPIHLIWRSRTDLQRIWPNASLPGANSGHTEDFITWAYNYGCGLKYPPAQYPGWIIFSTNDWKYNYDNNIRGVWNSRGDLQSIFLDAHYNYNPPFTSDIATMIEWARNYGYAESASIANYVNWPYVGTGPNQLPFNIMGSNVSLGSRNNEIPNGFVLDQNYPNPFNPSTTIRYGIPNVSHVKLTIFNSLGQLIVELVNSDLEAGYHETRFDASGLASGVYFYKIQAGGFVQTKRLLLLR